MEVKLRARERSDGSRSLHSRAALNLVTPRCMCLREPKCTIPTRSLFPAEPEIGKVRIPFLVDGSVSLATSSGALFGFTFCQSIPTGSPSGGVGCLVNDLPAYFNDQPPNVAFLSSAPIFSQLFNLDFAVPFGVPYDLNFTVTLQSGAAGLVGSSTADFAHTGIAQPAQVFDAAWHSDPECDDRGSVRIRLFRARPGARRLRSVLYRHAAATDATRVALEPVVRRGGRPAGGVGQQNLPRSGDSRELSPRNRGLDAAPRRFRPPGIE